MNLNTLIKHFTLAGAEVFYVGGYVRDKVLSKYHPEYTFEPKDIDLEIYRLYPEEVMKILDIFQIPYAYAGITFPVIKFTIEDKEIEVAFPRREISTGDKHKDFKVEIDPYMDKKEACKRRDFTFNAMLMTPSGKVIDYFNGEKDLKNKRISVTNKTTFQEDPLRAFRVFKFLAKFASKGVHFKCNIPTEFLRSMPLLALPEERIADEIYNISQLDIHSLKKMFKVLFNIAPKGNHLSVLVYNSNLPHKVFLNRKQDLRQYDFLVKLEKCATKKDYFNAILQHKVKYKENSFKPNFFVDALRSTKAKLSFEEITLLSNIRVEQFISKKELIEEHGVKPEQVGAVFLEKAWKFFS